MRQIEAKLDFGFGMLWPRVAAISKGKMEKIRVLLLLGQRGFLIRYRNDRLNILWAILEPATLAFAYWFLISQISGGSIGIEPYFLFLASGILPWLWFSHSVRDSQSVFKSDAKLMSSLGLSRKLWPLPVILSRFVDFILGYSFLLVLIGFYVGLEGSLILLLPAIAAQFILTLSLLYILAPLITLIPDFGRLVSVALRIGFFVTPILYLSVNVPGYLAPWLQLNPLSVVLDLYRHALFGGPILLDSVVGLSASIAALLFVGLIVYRSLQKTVLKALL